MLSVLPGTLPVAELARRLADTDAAVVVKLGRTYPQVRGRFHSGRLGDAVYVERASTADQRVMPAADVDDGGCPTSRWRSCPAVVATTPDRGRWPWSDWARRHRLDDPAEPSGAGRGDRP